MTPPPLMPFGGHGGDWDAYEEALNQVFMRRIAKAGLAFDGRKINCRRREESAGRWYAFWHLIQEGPVEDDREPDLRRCERLPWLPWVIENARSHPDIDVWENARRGERNCLLWYAEEYLVILAKRSDYFLLKTAYCTDRSGRVRQLRKERDAFRP